MPEHSLEWRKVKDVPRFNWNSTTDPKYLKDRAKFFKENGNGWWYTYTGKDIK